MRNYRETSFLFHPAASGGRKSRLRQFFPESRALVIPLQDATTCTGGGKHRSRLRPLLRTAASDVLQQNEKCRPRRKRPYSTRNEAFLPAKQRSPRLRRGSFRVVALFKQDYMYCLISVSSVPSEAILARAASTAAVRALLSLLMTMAYSSPVAMVFTTLASL